MRSILKNKLNYKGRELLVIGLVLIAILLFVFSLTI
jgi:hypothetical protein